MPKKMSTLDAALAAQVKVPEPEPEPEPEVPGAPTPDAVVRLQDRAKARGDWDLYLECQEWINQAAKKS